MNNITIPKKAMVRVYWDDKPDNLNTQDKYKIRDYFSTKYDIPKESITVIPRPIIIDNNGNSVEMSGVGIENIMDINYQHQLFKEWLKRENIDISFDRLIALDNKINEEINFKEEEYNNKSWKLKHLWINNFLCFGEDVSVDFDKLNGINVITSNPGNQSGKTSFSVDALMFLFFGVTSKTDKNEELFNQYTDKNSLKVKGLITINNSDFIIERTLKRSLKRSGEGYTIKNTVNYYEILPDGEEVQLEGEDGIKTTKKIVDTIGSEKDFMVTTLATSNNLEDLIDTQATARGKLLTKFIGLEIIEEKEQTARTLYNTFTKTMKSNIYNISGLEEEIVKHKESNITLSKTLNEYEDSLKTIKDELNTFNKEKEDFLLRKQDIDNEIIQLDDVKLTKEIEEITGKGVIEGENIKTYITKIKEIGDVNFDADKHEELLTNERSLKLDNETNSREIIRLTNLNEELLNSEICLTCKRPLEGVDNSEHINNNNLKIVKLKESIISTTELLTELSGKIIVSKQDKVLCDEKDKLELKKDRSDVVINSLRNDLQSKRNDLKRYKLNNDAIELNRTLDISISGVSGKIQRHESDRDTLTTNIQKCKSDIEQNGVDITIKEKLIKTINKEEEVAKIYKIYIDMVGKKGISKLVLRSVLPIINFELHRLLDDVTDFDLELDMNSKNEVEFILIKDGVNKNLKSGSGLEKTASALALRCVLTSISNLPKPNFIAFDEIFGKVANENLDYMKLLFDKIKDMFDIVLMITHNDIVKDWGDFIITIKKVNNISTITSK